MKPILKLTTIAALCFSFGYSAAKQIPQVVSQKDKNFSQEHLEVKLGDSVEFVNEDPFFHNVFSLSAASTFDLGSYPAGKSRTVTFDQPGEVLVECAIHPSMQMIIEVKE